MKIADEQASTTVCLFACLPSFRASCMLQRSKVAHSFCFMLNGNCSCSLINTDSNLHNTHSGELATLKTAGIATAEPAVVLLVLCPDNKAKTQTVHFGATVAKKKF